MQLCNFYSPQVRSIPYKEVNGNLGLFHNAPVCTFFFFFFPPSELVFFKNQFVVYIVTFFPGPAICLAKD